MVVRVSSSKGNPLKKTWPTARFEVSQRADDRHVIELIREHLGFGRIYVHTANAGRPHERTAVKFSCFRIEDNLKLIDVFREYPLRSKKRHQFEVWAAAVHEIAKGRHRDDAFIDGQREKLRALRVFNERWSEGWTRPIEPPLVHKLDHGEAPTCLCGCGTLTKLLRNRQGVPHPQNPFFSRFTNGHNRRVLQPVS